MESYKRRYRLLSQIPCLLLTFVLLFSCSNSVPTILSTTYTLVLDYSDENTTPSQRLALFVSPSSEVSRFSELTIQNKKENLTWTIKEAQFFKEKQESYAGYTNIVPQSDKTFSSGDYLVTYKDSASNTCETTVKISNIEIDTSKMYSELTEDDFAKFPVVKIALYDVSGTLLYFGSEFSKDTPIETIKKKYTKALSYRFYYGKNDNSCGLFSPPELIE